MINFPCEKCAIPLIIAKQLPYCIFNNPLITLHPPSTDELFIRRKKRQFREKQEKKREKVINEINDRQMGKMLKSASANIDICSTAQFPECGILNDMPALTSNVNEQQMPSSSSKSLPSFANVINFCRIYTKKDDK